MMVCGTNRFAGSVKLWLGPWLKYYTILYKVYFDHGQDGLGKLNPSVTRPSNNTKYLYEKFPKTKASTTAYYC